MSAIERNRTTVLVTEHLFHPFYLISRWNEIFKDTPIAPILLRDDQPSNLDSILNFFGENAGKTKLTDAQHRQIVEFFGEFSKSEQAMVERYGVPEVDSEAFLRNVEFVGKDLNQGLTIDTLLRLEGSHIAPAYLVFLDRILKHPLWLQIANNDRVFNAHSAVLPLAPGMCSIQLVAALHPEMIAQCAGATLHYVNQDIDAGDIVEVARIEDPFESTSIHDLKGRSYDKAFDLIARYALLLRDSNYTAPKSPNDVKQCINEVDTKDGKKRRPFMVKDYTHEREQRAEANFLALSLDKTKENNA